MAAATLNNLGPGLHTSAPAFQLPTCDRQVIGLDTLMGERGLLLGFTGDIWQPVTVRRMIWLQRHSAALRAQGIEIALLVSSPPHMLAGFRVSSALVLDFTLLADVDGETRQRYQIDAHGGLILLDNRQIIRGKWLALSERGWPQSHSLFQVCANL